MLVKLCAKCGEVIPQGERLCVKCKGQEEPKHTTRSQVDYDKNRDTRVVAFRNSKEWRIARKFVMQRDEYLCQECKAKGVLAQATSVHHKVPMYADWSKRLDFENLVALCYKCHAKADAKARAVWEGEQKKFASP